MGALIYLRPDRDQPADPGPEPAEQRTVRDAGFDMVRTVQLAVPPGVATRRGLVADRVERWAERLMWAPSHQLFYTQHLLADLDEVEQGRYVEFVRNTWKRDPGRASVLITVLGEFQHPDAEQLVLEAARHPNNRVRSEAARALTLMDSPSAARRAEDLLEDPMEMVRRTALRALTMMADPEALAALERYAERSPEEGIRHVLHRLGQNTEDPSVIPVLRKYLDRDGMVQHTALEGLVRFGDGNAIDRLYQMMASSDVVEQSRGLKLMLQAPPEMVDLTQMEAMLAHRMPEMRLVAGAILVAIARNPEEDQRQLVEEFLNRQVADSDVRVRKQSLGGLYLLGRKDVAEAYLKGIATLSAAALHESVELTTQVFKDQRALDAILRRLETETDMRDRSILLSGLGNLQAPEAVDVFLAIIRGASPDELLDSNGIPLSKTAVHHLPKLGPETAGPLLALIRDREAHEQARLRAIDALRGVEGADLLDPLIELIVDPEQGRAIRLAAVESLPFLKRSDLFEELEPLVEGIEDLEVKNRVTLILFNYS